MFIVTARLPKRRLLTAGLTALCCCVAVIAGIFCLQSLDSVSAASEVKGIRDNDDRIAYLEQFGWTVSSEPIAVEELLIPETFDASYDEYLALQSEQGFDLTVYCGKRVKRYTYEITNYPTGESGVQAALLLYRNKVIGGEVLSSNPDGFLHGLAMPDQT